MVDLSESLRPTGTVAPTPVGEIAARAGRRRRRRMATRTGLAVATVGIAGFALAGLAGPAPDTTTVADGETTEATTVTTPTSPRPTSSPPTTSSPVTSSRPTSSSPATSSPPTPSSVSTTPGIRTSSTITSEWEDGYCVQVEVANESSDQQAWQVVLDLGGTVASPWNATVVELADGSAVFAGLEGYNAVVGAGAATSFGTCVDLVDG